MSYESETGADLVRELPSIFPRDDESGNYKLFQVVGHEFDHSDEDVDTVDRATTVQHADTVEQLERLGQLVNSYPREGESRDKYRSRVIGSYQLVTCEGTIGDIINSVAVILDADPERIEYRDFSEDMTMGVGVPKDKLDAMDLSDQELSNIINDLAAAGARIEAQVVGTLAYISPSDYDYYEENDWTRVEGYDGLDSNGDPKESPDAGTYAGTLE